MKRLLRIALLLAAVSPVVAAQEIVDSVPPVRSTPDGYWPLVCKGGPSISIDFSVRTNGQSSQALITFGKGARPSGSRGENLAAGTCSWIDRGMDDNEPNRIFDNSPGAVSIYYVLSDDGIVRSQRVDIPYFVLKRTNQVFYLMVKRVDTSFWPRLNPFNQNRLLTQVRTFR